VALDNRVVGAVHYNFEQQRAYSQGRGCSSASPSYSHRGNNKEITTILKKPLVYVDGYGVYFNHNYSNQFPYNRMTVCEIWNFNGGVNRESKGIAKVHQLDNFCKATGRVLSLKRALGEDEPFTATISPELRDKIWRGYWAVVKHGDEAGVTV
jgi:hypothetical protein